MLAIYLAVIDDEQDKSKFELLYTTYRKLMFYIANRILNDEYLAEDAVHQTFLKIIEDLNKLKDVHCHKTKSYIIVMVRNYAINLYNRMKRHSTIPIEQADYWIMDETSNEKFNQIEDLDYLAKVIIKLPVIYKEVLTLKYVQEFTTEEIAHCLGVSEAAVRKRLERARHKIKEVLENEENADVL
jgi:RNA polymerase sigma-70 factor (ECF subfamily)